MTSGQQVGLCTPRGSSSIQRLSVPYTPASRTPPTACRNCAPLASYPRSRPPDGKRPPRPPAASSCRLSDSFRPLPGSSRSHGRDPKGTSYLGDDLHPARNIGVASLLLTTLTLMGACSAISTLTSSFVSALPGTSVGLAAVRSHRHHRGLVKAT